MLSIHRKLINIIPANIMMALPQVCFQYAMRCHIRRSYQTHGTECKNVHISLTFGRHPSSNATEKPTQFYSDWSSKLMQNVITLKDPYCLHIVSLFTYGLSHVSSKVAHENIFHNSFPHFLKYKLIIGKNSVYHGIWVKKRLFSRLQHMCITCPTWFEQVKYIHCKIWDWNRMWMHICVKWYSFHLEKSQMYWQFPLALPIQPKCDKILYEFRRLRNQ